MTNNVKKKVAVFFGGPSAEHDVSILSGLQTLGAIDRIQFDAFPVYMAPGGRYYVGSALTDKKIYPLNENDLPKTIQEVTLYADRDQPVLRYEGKTGLFSKPKNITYDIAFPVFHGTGGEDGCFQGMMQFMGVPYTGPRQFLATLSMNKVKAKQFFMQLGLPVLPYISIKKPAQKERFLNVKELYANIDLRFPLCAKPCNLGSSIGVHKVSSEDELDAALLDIFQMDEEVILEPFIDHLIEYNVAVANDPETTNHVRFSAIERPLNGSDEGGKLLDFKDKYQSGGSGKDGHKLGNDSKLGVRLSEGMVSSTREFYPQKLSAKNQDMIYAVTATLFQTLDGTGAPRLDFYGNSQTGELWLNEINVLPGSYGYFLWEASKNPVGFTELTTDLINEGFDRHRVQQSLNRRTQAGKSSLF